MTAPNNQGGKPPEPVQGTRLESDDEIKQAILARRARLAGKPASPDQGAAVQAEADVKPERPSLRPPVGHLCILDDGKIDGEWVRLRADRTVIGRNEGAIIIPHDGMISSRHAEIVRNKSGHGYRWQLTDLGSTNGTFVRIGSTILRPGNELLLGGGRYRFEAGLPPSDAPTQEHTPGGTKAWAGSPLQTIVPALVEITPAGPGQRHPLTKPEYWIGRDTATCGIVRPDDKLANPRHARLYRDPAGHWHIENNKSHNGLWFRIDPTLPLQGACQFRLGEQRFIFKVTR